MFHLAIKFGVLYLTMAVMLGCATKSQVGSLSIPREEVAVSAGDKPRFDQLETLLLDAQYDAASALVKELESRYSDYMPLVTNKALILIYQGAASDAIKLLQSKAVATPDLLPDQASTFGQRYTQNYVYRNVVLGEAYFADNQFRNAAKAYQEALNYDPESIFAHYGLGVIYDLYLQDYQIAEEHYGAFLKSADSDTNANEIKKVKVWLRLLGRKADRRSSS